jgi:lysozyme family protein
MLTQFEDIIEVVLHHEGGYVNDPDDPGGETNFGIAYFDMCVNQGRGRAVKILQQAANAKGAELKVDGGLGPKTIGAMKGVELERVRAYRVKYYADLVTRKPDLEKFYFGWFRRALEV